MQITTSASLALFNQSELTTLQADCMADMERVPHQAIDLLRKVVHPDAEGVGISFVDASDGVKPLHPPAYGSTTTPLVAHPPVYPATTPIANSRPTDANLWQHLSTYRKISEQNASLIAEIDTLSLQAIRHYYGPTLKTVSTPKWQGFVDSICKRNGIKREIKTLERQIVRLEADPRSSHAKAKLHVNIESTLAGGTIIEGYAEITDRRRFFIGIPDVLSLRYTSDQGQQGLVPYFSFQFRDEAPTDLLSSWQKKFAERGPMLFAKHGLGEFSRTISRRDAEIIDRDITLRALFLEISLSLTRCRRFP